MKRRILLTAAVAGVGSSLFACGGGSGSGAAADKSPPTPGAWNIDPAPRFLAGSLPGVYDLAATLPAGIARGGVFGVDSSGAPLPLGMTLSTAGILTATDAAKVGATSGVVFRYTEPG